MDDIQYFNMYFMNNLCIHLDLPFLWLSLIWRHFFGDSYSLSLWFLPRVAHLILMYHTSTDFVVAPEISSGSITRITFSIWGYARHWTQGQINACNASAFSSQVIPNLCIISLNLWSQSMSSEHWQPHYVYEENDSVERLVQYFLPCSTLPGSNPRYPIWSSEHHWK